MSWKSIPRPLLALFCVFLSACQGDGFTARVVRVADGDTITVLKGREQVRIRVEGIDCPERGQDFGTRARHFTRDLVMDKTVEIRPKEWDAHGRLVARVIAGGSDLSEELVRAGLAWHFTRYSNDPVLAALESDARRNKAGLWSHPRPVPPWDWRSRSRVPAR